MPMPMYNYGGYYPQNYQQGTQMSSPQSMQIQNGGLISVRSELEARNYPIAPGNSITFKDENSPYVYTKTMGFSQLDRPTFEKFRLVREDTTESFANAPNQPQAQNPINLSDYVKKDELEALRSQFEALRKEINNEFHKSAPSVTTESNAISDAKTI